MSGQLVSVVIGVHNGGDKVISSLDSILQQEGIDLECIVVDDGSNDTTAEVLREFAVRDQRLLMHRVERGGLTQALITGCARARGDFIARQDVGDISMAGRLEKQAELLASRQELAFVGCRFETVGPDGEILGTASPEDNGESIVESLKELPLSGLKGPHHGSVMFRRSAYESVGGYRPEFYFAQDLDLWTRLIEVGDLGFVNEVLYQVSFAPGSLTARHRSQQMQLRDLIREASLLRRDGKSEAQVLHRAAQVRPAGVKPSRLSNAAAEYYIGSCLHHRGDPAAATYLRRAIQSNPLHLKAWIRLAACGWRRA